MGAYIEVLAPDGVCGNWRIETFTISEKEAEWHNLRCVIGGNRGGNVRPGTYKRLMRGSTVVMSNTPMEVRTNRWLIDHATGDVLINGLGLGMVLGEVLKKDCVKSVTVVEAAEEVIQLVGPTFAGDPRVKIVHADAFEYKPEKGAYFHVVWHDIWDYITADNLEEMGRLHRKYARRCGWQDSWCKRDCQQLKRQGW